MTSTASHPFCFYLCYHDTNNLPVELNSTAADNRQPNQRCDCNVATDETHQLIHNS